MFKTLPSLFRNLNGFLSIIGLLACFLLAEIRLGGFFFCLKGMLIWVISFLSDISDRILVDNGFFMDVMIPSHYMSTIHLIVCSAWHQGLLEKRNVIFPLNCIGSFHPQQHRSVLHASFNGLFLCSPRHFAANSLPYRGFGLVAKPVLKRERRFLDSRKMPMPDLKLQYFLD